MKPMKLTLGKHKLNVSVSRSHLKRALQVMEKSVLYLSSGWRPADTAAALHAAAIIAVVEEFPRQFEHVSSADFDLVEEALSRDYLRDQACLSYDLVASRPEPSVSNLDSVIEQCIAAVATKPRAKPAVGAAAIS